MVSLSLSIAFSRSSAELKASKTEWFVPPIQADLGDGVVLFYLQYIYIYIYIYCIYIICMYIYTSLPGGFAPSFIDYK